MSSGTRSTPLAALISGAPLDPRERSHWAARRRGTSLFSEADPNSVGLAPWVEGNTRSTHLHLESGCRISDMLFSR